MSNTYTWTKLRNTRVQIGRANNEPCCMCGGAINYDLPGTMNLGPTAEHLTPIAFGGSKIVPLEQLGVAHRRCQNKQGAKIQKIMQRSGGPKRSEKHEAYERQKGVMRYPEPASLVPTVSSEELIEPHYFSDKHPDAVDTLAPEWEAYLAENLNFRLRPWQSKVLERALEVDADGKLCWREVVVSAPRQSGKSFLIWAINLARAQHSERFGEPQECLHVANNLAAARRIHQRAWRWAESEGIKVYRAWGGERLVWPDASHWSITSPGSIWGWSASQAVVDEAWDIDIEVIDSALLPTLVERQQPMLWLFSTANAQCTSLFLEHRKDALRGDRRVMIAEWSADYHADVMDPQVWRQASPFWTQQRGEIMQSSAHKPSFREQWLNIWPNVNPEVEWSQQWGRLPLGHASGVLIGAIESAFDRSCYGVAVASVNADAMVNITAAVVKSEEAGRQWLLQRQPAAVFTGANMKDRISGPWTTIPSTNRETIQASPWLTNAVRNGTIAHNHDPDVGAQMGLAVISGLETGPSISARKSKGPIPVVKAVAWCGAAASEDWLGLRATTSIF